MHTCISNIYNISVRENMVSMLNNSRLAEHIPKKFETEKRMVVR